MPSSPLLPLSPSWPTGTPQDVVASPNVDDSTNVIDQSQPKGSEDDNNNNDEITQAEDDSQQIYLALDAEAARKVTGVEPLEWYCEGGLHPVHLGDVLNDRYVVSHKLGHGGFGTVWLCRDLTTGKWQAVKILAANVSTADCADLRALDLFRSIDSKTLNENHITLPTGQFWLNGPNGDHLCLVLPFLGTPLSYLFDVYGHCPELMKDICFQLVEAMAFLHSHGGICHGDFRPENILFHIAEGVDEWPEEKLFKVMEAPIRVPVIAVGPNGQTAQKPCNNGVPQYLVGKADIDYGTGLCSTKITVTDFGVSYPIDCPPQQGQGTGIPLSYLAPEGLFCKQHLLGPQTDLWSLACSIMEIRVGISPFGDGGATVPGLIENMEASIGPLPQPYRAQWKHWIDEADVINAANGLGEESPETQVPFPEDESLPITFDQAEENGIRKQRFKERGTEEYVHYRMLAEFVMNITSPEAAEIAKQEHRVTGTLPAYPPSSAFMDYKSRNKVRLSRHEADQLFDLVMSVFRWHPHDRPSAVQLLDHPWFGDRNASRPKDAWERSDDLMLDFADEDLGVSDASTPPKDHEKGVDRHPSPAPSDVFTGSEGGSGSSAGDTSDGSDSDQDDFVPPVQASENPVFTPAGSLSSSPMKKLREKALGMINGSKLFQRSPSTDLQAPLTPPPTPPRTVTVEEEVEVTPKGLLFPPAPANTDEVVAQEPTTQPSTVKRKVSDESLDLTPKKRRTLKEYWTRSTNKKSTTAFTDEAMKPAGIQPPPSKTQRLRQSTMSFFFKSARKSLAVYERVPVEDPEEEEEKAETQNQDGRRRPLSRSSSLQPMGIILPPSLPPLPFPSTPTLEPSSAQDGWVSGHDDTDPEKRYVSHALLAFLDLPSSKHQSLSNTAHTQAHVDTNPPRNRPDRSSSSFWPCCWPNVSISSVSTDDTTASMSCAENHGQGEKRCEQGEEGHLDREGLEPFPPQGQGIIHVEDSVALEGGRLLLQGLSSPQGIQVEGGLQDLRDGGQDASEDGLSSTLSSVSGKGEEEAASRCRGGVVRGLLKAVLVKVFSVRMKRRVE